jgi:hypothetical protein
MKPYENEQTIQSIKDMLTSDAVIKEVMAHLHFTVNDDMFNGCTLVAEILQKGCSPHMQLQIRLTRSESNYFNNYHGKSPKIFIDKAFNLSKS